MGGTMGFSWLYDGGREEQVQDDRNREVGRCLDWRRACGIPRTEGKEEQIEAKVEKASALSEAAQAIQLAKVKQAWPLGRKVEVKQSDPGLMGAWFEGEIIDYKGHDQCVVRYDELHEGDDSDKEEEPAEEKPKEQAPALPKAEANGNGEAAAAGGEASGGGEGAPSENGAAAAAEGAAAAAGAAANGHSENGSSEKKADEFEFPPLYECAESLQNIRPMPPQVAADASESHLAWAIGLQPGAALDLKYDGGWWNVELIHVWHIPQAQVDAALGEGGGGGGGGGGPTDHADAARRVRPPRRRRRMRRRIGLRSRRSTSTQNTSSPAPPFARPIHGMARRGRYGRRLASGSPRPSIRRRPPPTRRRAAEGQRQEERRQGQGGRQGCGRRACRRVAGQPRRAGGARVVLHRRHAAQGRRWRDVRGRSAARVRRPPDVVPRGDKEHKTEARRRLRTDFENCTGRERKAKRRGV